MGRRYRKNSYEFGLNIPYILAFIALYLFFMIVSFILKYKNIIINILIISTIVFIIVLLIIKRNKIIEIFNNIKNKKILKKLKNTTLYEKIKELNNKYKFEKLDVISYNHYVKSKIYLQNINFDDYLILTIDKNYDEIQNYRTKYYNILKEYDNYEKEYNNLIQFININESKNLKLNQEQYKKYQELLLENNKIKLNINFGIDININYSSKKEYVKKSIHKCYFISDFNEIYNRYNEMKNNGKIMKINSEIERSKINSSIRYDVLKRDNYRCKICGRGSKDGVKLHVDHIIPVSKGGKTEMNNLQTLCSDCNIGKSNKI